jgi:hypothetical protein
MACIIGKALTDTRLAESGLFKAFNAEMAAKNAARRDSAMVRWLQRHASACVFLALIGIGIVLHSVPDDWLKLPWLQSVKRPLSDALSVAGFLGLTVDWFLKRALIRDVGAIFIGWALPQEVRNYIREVSQMGIIRKNSRTHYKLTIDGDSVKVEVTGEVEVYNFSTGIRVYRPSISLDLHDHPDESAIRCEWTVGNKLRSWDAKKFNEKPKYVEKGPHVTTWNIRGMSLLPQDVNDPQLRPACIVRWTYSMRMPIPYTDFNSFNLPTIGAVITADCPNELEFVSDDPIAHAEGSSRWSYPRLYMPGQAIRVRWQRRILAPENRLNA